jgi:hypothetical protein
MMGNIQHLGQSDIIFKHLLGPEGIGGWNWDCGPLDRNKARVRRYYQININSHVMHALHYRLNHTGKSSVREVCHAHENHDYGHANGIYALSAPAHRQPD